MLRRGLPPAERVPLRGLHVGKAQRPSSASIYTQARLAFSIAEICR